jgi:protein transport protein SEC24
MRTRFSKGYKISSFITPILISNGDLMIMSTLDSDQSYAIQIEAIHTLDNNTQGVNIYNTNCEPFMYIQTAILYTHSDGTRRIRVHNLCLPVVNRLIDVFEGVDAESLNAFLLKLIIDKIFKTKKITNCVLQLSSMAKSMISSALMTQHSLKKELPSNLIPFILYILGALKHRVLCRDEIERKLDIDLSNYMRIKIQKLSVFDIQSFIYPRIYPLQNLLEDNSLGNYDEYGNCLVPDVIYQS